MIQPALLPATGPFQLLLAAGSVAGLLAAMWLVRRAAGRRGLSAELQRKLVHVGTGLYALTLPWLFADRWPVLALVAMALAAMFVMRLPRVAKGGIGAALHGVERKSYGDLLLALAIGTVFVLSDGEAILYVLPIAILTLADAAAALTGSRYGRAFFSVEDGRKSVEGSVAFFAVALIVSMVCLLLLSEVSRGGVIILSVIVAAFATQVEAESWRGFDNFFLPAGVMVFLQAHLGSAPAELMLIAALFMGATAAFLLGARELGLPAHAARVYAIAVFLLLSVTAAHNAVLPILVFAAHGLVRRLNPSPAAHPELDVVASLALVSFGWLVLGLVTGLNALPFYGLTALGFSVGLVTLGLVAAPLPLRVGVPLAASAALLWLWEMLMPLNMPNVAWAGDLTALALLAAALCLAVPLLASGAFAAARAARVALLASLAPLCGFLWSAARTRGLL